MFKQNWTKNIFTLKKMKIILCFFGSYLFLGFFLKITLEIIKGQSFKNRDESILLFIANHFRTQTLTEIAVNITALGSPALISFFTIISFVILLIKKDKLGILFLAINVIGSSLWMILLKNVVARDRPNIVPRLIEITGLSYPSGHSLVSTATYLSMAFLFYRRTDSRFLKLMVLLLAGLIISLIAFSRIYLGVHYPSDVLSGIIFGLSFFLWLTALFKSFSTF